MATTTVYQPTASQWAAAAMHLERRSEWRYFRSAGVRYVSVVSGRSNRLWIARADAAGCGCPWSQNMSTPCSHRIALELDALEADLTESARTVASEAECDLIFAEAGLRLRGDGAGRPIKTYEQIYRTEN